MWSVRAIDSFVYMSSGNIQRISGISNYIQRSLLTRSLSRKYEKYKKCHVQSTIVHSYIHTVNKYMFLFCLKIFSRLTKSYHYHTHSGPQIRYPLTESSTAQVTCTHKWKEQRRALSLRFFPFVQQSETVWFWNGLTWKSEKIVLPFELHPV